MTCNDCTFCNEDITILQNLMSDARARGSYRLANGLEKALRNCSNLQANLSSDNRAYLENIARIAKSDTWPADEQTLLLRDAQNVVKMVKQKPEPQRATPTGFKQMLEHARPSNPTSPTRPESETRSTVGFHGMLSAISGRKRAHGETLRRAIDESQFPRVCNPMLCPPDFARHCRANRQEHHGQPCIYVTLTNEELKHGTQ